MPSRITDVRAAYQFFYAALDVIFNFSLSCEPRRVLKAHKLNNWIEIMDGFKSNRVPILCTRVTFRIFIKAVQLITFVFIFTIILIVILTTNKNRKLYQ